MAQYTVWRPGGPWTSLAELRRGMDDLFSRLDTRPLSGSGVFPPVNLYETQDAYVLTAELPGVEPNAIEVNIEGNRVTLRGERRIEHAGDASLHRIERQSGAFRRSFELPAAIDTGKCEAVHRNGVLMLRVPKAPEAQPRQIAVSTG